MHGVYCTQPSCFSAIQSLVPMLLLLLIPSDIFPFEQDHVDNFVYIVPVITNPMNFTINFNTS